MRLLIVIVNFRTADLTIDCLRSLRDEIALIPESRVVVTDNASGDDSAAKIQAAISVNEWSRWATLLPLEHNGGFSYGNNTAIRPALQGDDKPQYVLLLNPDTLVRPGALSALLDYMDQTPEVGIAGSRLEHPDGSAQPSAFRFPTPLSELEEGARLRWLSRLLARRIVAPPVSPRSDRVEWVAGASMIIRRQVFEEIGLLDERYFMYYEEVDFCRRANRAGWICAYVPASRVVHLVGQSSGVTDMKRARKRRPAYWFESRQRYFLTHFGQAKTLAANVLWAAGFAQWRVRCTLLRKPHQDPDRLWRDFIWHNFVRSRTTSAG